MKRLLVICLLIILTFSGCDQNDLEPITTTNNSPTKIVLQPGFGAIKGQLVVPKIWENKILYSYAAPYLGDPDGEGIFILDDKLNESSEIQSDGNFFIDNIPPGLYILVVGPDPETALAYREEGIAKKFEVGPNQFLDVGIIEIDF